MKAGILSDTHDLLRPEVIDALQGCDYILHAGDISSQRILDRLEQIAPVKVVRGNNDKEWAEHLPLFLDFELGGLLIFMTHKKKDLPKDLTAYDLVICGHTHQYAEVWQTPAAGNRTLLFNPGSCGPRRFNQPITMAILSIDPDGWVLKQVGFRTQPGKKLRRSTVGTSINRLKLWFVILKKAFRLIRSLGNTSLIRHWWNRLSGYMSHTPECQWMAS